MQIVGGREGPSDGAGNDDDNRQTEEQTSRDIALRATEEGRGASEKNMIYCCWFSVWFKSKSSSGSSFVRSKVRRIFSESESFQRVIFSSCCSCAAREWKRTTTTERSFIGMYFHALQSSSGESNLLVTVKLGDFFFYFFYTKNADVKLWLFAQAELRCCFFVGICWFKYGLHDATICHAVFEPTHSWDDWWSNEKESDTWVGWRANHIKPIKANPEKTKYHRSSR